MAVADKTIHILAEIAMAWLKVTKAYSFGEVALTLHHNYDDIENCEGNKCCSDILDPVVVAISTVRAL